MSVPSPLRRVSVSAQVSVLALALAAAGPAHAQSILGGDFESAGKFTGWTVDQGAQNRVDEIDSDIRSSRVLEIDRNNNNDLVVCSSPFVATRVEVRAVMHALTNSNGRTSWWLRESGTQAHLVSAVSFAPDDSAGPYSTHTLDATLQCGLTLEVCLEPDANDTIYYDDFVLQGAACPSYVDDDGDHYCPTGHDLDNNGDCADDAEFDQVSDCDDGDGAVSPAAVESCNTIDDNCVDGIDEGFDLDSDSFTTCGGDCNDGDDAVHPNVLELCNAVDDDCDLLVDEDFDLDHDTFTTCDGDCDDAAVNVFPDAPEQCNEVDDDCDGMTDEDITESPWWPDRDHDGYGDEALLPEVSCRAPDGSVTNGTDCDDGDASIHPGAPDVAVDGIDADCDGVDGSGEPPPSTTDPPTDPGTTAPPPDTGAPADPDDVMIAVQEGCGCGNAPSHGAGVALGLVLIAALRRRR